jgi:hypothetical protein
LIGTTVLVRNKGGTQISARIVAQISAVQGGLHNYGIEFVEEDAVKFNNFWGGNLAASSARKFKPKSNRQFYWE